MIENAEKKYRTATEAIGVYIRQSSRRKFNGKPDICFDISYQVGNRLIWEKIGFQSEGASLKMAQDIRADRMRAIRHDSKNLPICKKEPPYFKDIAERYLSWSKENKNRQGKEDLSRYKNHLSPRFDHLRLDEITPLDLERMKEELKKKGLSLGTTEHCLKLFRQMVNKARIWGLFEGENPIKGVKIPNAQCPRMRFLSYEEADRLLQELAKVSIQVHDIALISLHTGMRAGEIFGLRNYDIDFRNGLINISDSKNGESRNSFMTEAVRDILMNRVNGSPTDYIFKTWKGTKIQEISDTYPRVVEKMGFNKGITDRRYKITFHSLRHTHASWLAMQGETLLTIKELLGHKTLDMTLRYAHLIPDQKRQATLTLEKIFNDKKNALSLVNIHVK